MTVHVFSIACYVMEVSQTRNQKEMNTTRISAVDVHSEHITLDMIQEELRVNPWRLEEKKGANDWDTHEGNTPLISSAAFGNLEVCEYLLSVGANIKAKNTV